MIALPHHPPQSNRQFQPHRQPQTRCHLGYLGQTTCRHGAQEQSQEGAHPPVALRVGAPSPGVELRVDKQVTQQGGEHDGGDLIKGEDTGGADLTARLEGEERDGKYLHPLDWGARIFGLGADDFELDEEGGRQDAGGLDAEGEDKGGASAGVDESRDVDEDDVAGDEGHQGNKGFGP